MYEKDASPRVRLEVAFLDADQAAPAPAPSAALDERTCLTVAPTFQVVDFNTAFATGPARPHGIGMK